MFKRIGLDCYCIKIPLLSFIRICKNNQICCYDVKVKEEKCIFYANTYDRKRIKSVFPSAQYLFTTGIVGMFLRNFKNKYRVLSYVICICIWLFLHSTLFSVCIYGENDALENEMQIMMNTYMYKKIDVHEIKENLLKTFKNQIHWLEVYRTGNHIDVYYKEKTINQITQNANAPLIAKKDGMIAYFECDKGNKIKHVNDIVYKGDLLVDNKMLTSNNEIINLEVNGKVFAYTWNKVSIEMKENTLADAINYFSLLLQARDEIYQEINPEEKIVKENVLQFTRNEGTIRLVILYTLLEDITS